MKGKAWTDHSMGSEVDRSSPFSSTEIFSESADDVWMKKMLPFTPRWLKEAVTESPVRERGRGERVGKEGVMFMSTSQPH